MKLRQTEYCHNCNKYVEFEFEDTVEKQVIYCPNCQHEHYRELDEGTIINIRINPSVREVRIAKIPSISVSSFMDSSINITPSVNITYETKKVLGTDENGNAIVEGQGRKTISHRRWGQDSSQRRT